MIVASLTTHSFHLCISHPLITSNDREMKARYLLSRINPLTVATLTEIKLKIPRAVMIKAFLDAHKRNLFGTGSYCQKQVELP